MYDDGKDVMPARALISLDINNMFNEVSRKKLCQVISVEFPELLDFADCLYEEPGQTVLQLKDGTWELFPCARAHSGRLVVGTVGTPTDPTSKQMRTGVCLTN